ncbi:acyltransferase family protein [Collimonas pratensis]|uniref:Acyltransferase family protein n=1 Tax=Collimonas pratensis TaxID=279113 RepID=A0A127Q033_9BURK|nr:acyltransferase [Collimonas pratensis]AMP03399.1 acyltransferase family protein [Collimonas pratensis]
MGLIRFFLALSVVFSHNGIHVPGIDGLLAVYAFFVISGFYMALVLNEKYQDNVAGFYGARFLRLWPSYIVVLLVVLLLIAPMSSAIYTSTLAAVYTWTVNLTMFFYNTLGWFGIDSATGKLVFLATPEGGASALLNAAHMPHIWSIGEEISFYLLAPFIARKPKTILAVLAMALLIHVAIMSDLYPLHPLQRYSGFNTFWLFLFGMTAYHGWKKYNASLERMRLDALWCSIFGVGISIACIIAAQKLWDHQILLCIPFALFAACVIPLFHATRRSRVDKFVGELSYPIYLTHWPVVAYLIVDHQGSWYWSFVIAGISIACSIALYFCVDFHVEKIRRRLARTPVGLAGAGVDSSHGEAPRPTAR